MARKNDKVQAVIFRMVGNKPQFLMLHRIPKRSGTWQSVSGGIEKGETPEEALKREIFEETGIKEKEIIDYKETMQSSFGDKGKKRHEITFAVEVRPDVLITDENNVYKEHDQWKWCSAEEAASLAKWAVNKEMIRRIEAERR